MSIRRLFALAFAALIAGPLVSAESAHARGGGGGGGGGYGGGSRGGGGNYGKAAANRNTKQEKAKKKDLEQARERLRQVDYRDRDSSFDRSSL